MTVIPNFILKKLYVAGSLRLVPEGVAFDITNPLGPGILTRINAIKLNDVEYLAHQIVLKLEDKFIHAAEISENNPVTLFLNQSATCILRGAELAVGKHIITVDLLSKEAGKVTLSIHDQVSPEPA